MAGAYSPCRERCGVGTTCSVTSERALREGRAARSYCRVVLHPARPGRRLATGSHRESRCALDADAVGREVGDVSPASAVAHRGLRGRQRRRRAGAVARNVARLEREARERRAVAHRPRVVARARVADRLVRGELKASRRAVRFAGLAGAAPDSPTSLSGMASVTSDAFWQSAAASAAAPSQPAPQLPTSSTRRLSFGARAAAIARALRADRVPAERQVRERARVLHPRASSRAPIGPSSLLDTCSRTLIGSSVGARLARAPTSPRQLASRTVAGEGRASARRGACAGTTTRAALGLRVLQVGLAARRHAA